MPLSRVPLSRVPLSRVPLSRVPLPRAHSPGEAWEKNLLTWTEPHSQQEKTPAAPWTLRVKHHFFAFFPFFLLVFLFFSLFSPFPPWMVFASWELVKGRSSHSSIFPFPVKFWQFVSTARTCLVVQAPCFELQLLFLWGNLLRVWEFTNSQSPKCLALPAPAVGVDMAQVVPA